MIQNPKRDPIPSLNKTLKISDLLVKRGSTEFIIKSMSDKNIIHAITIIRR